MVARRPGTAESRMEFGGKKELWRQWLITWTMRPLEVDIEAGDRRRSMEAGARRGNAGDRNRCR